MKKFTLGQIAAACGGKYVGDEALRDTPVSSIERDSRCIKENSLFLAIKGARVDGHDFIQKCYEFFYHRIRADNSCHITETA